MLEMPKIAVNLECVNKLKMFVQKLSNNDYYKYYRLKVILINSFPKIQFSHKNKGQKKLITVNT